MEHTVSLIAVNRAIRAVCLEVNSLNTEGADWRLLTEDELFYETAVCVFGSQMMFETAVAAAERLKELGLLSWNEAAKLSDEYEGYVIRALSTAVCINVNGTRRFVLPRFRNRLAAMLATTVTTLREERSSLSSLLRFAESAKHARKLLVSAVSGFGPKQASLFLRRVGYCSELAVLDTHVLDYLRLSLGIDPKPGALSRLHSYERIELEFFRVAREFGHAVGCVDLAMWVTMRVAKREAILWV